jgi:outer membrane lipoprotein carrier protein
MTRECSPAPGRCQRKGTARRESARTWAAAASLLVALLGAPPGTGAAARAEEAARAAKALEARLNAVRGLSARFTQTLESAALPAPQVEEGTVYLMRPGRMRWEYHKPPGKLAVADGRKSWLFLPEDRQVLVAPLPDPGHDQGIGLLSRERVDVLREFSAEWGPPFTTGGRASLVLRPRSREAPFERLAIERDATDFPVRLMVLDPLGGSVTYRFHDLHFADRLDEGLFRFEPPAGIAVQEVAP